MPDSVHNIEILKNMGIDKDAIAKVQIVEDDEKQTIVRPDTPIGGTNLKPAANVADIKKEILDITYGQLVDLAGQFKQFADNVEQRLGNIENAIERLQKAPTVAHEIQQVKEEPQQRLTKEQPKEEIELTSEDVSIEKMFDFSNTKGNQAPRPNR